jgi:hypothetical protein
VDIRALNIDIVASSRGSPRTRWRSSPAWRLQVFASAGLERAPGAGKRLAMALSRNPVGPSLYKWAPKSTYRVAAHQFIVA